MFIMTHWHDRSEAGEAKGLAPVGLLLFVLALACAAMYGRAVSTGVEVVSDSSSGYAVR